MVFILKSIAVTAVLLAPIFAAPLPSTARNHGLVSRLSSGQAASSGSSSNSVFPDGSQSVSTSVQLQGNDRQPRRRSAISKLTPQTAAARRFSYQGPTVLQTLRSDSDAPYTHPKHSPGDKETYPSDSDSDSAESQTDVPMRGAKKSASLSDTKDAGNVPSGSGTSGRKNSGTKSTTTNTSAGDSGGRKSPSRTSSSSSVSKKPEGGPSNTKPLEKAEVRTPSSRGSSGSFVSDESTSDGTREGVKASISGSKSSGSSLEAQRPGVHVKDRPFTAEPEDLQSVPGSQASESNPTEPVKSKSTLKRRGASIGKKRMGSALPPSGTTPQEKQGHNQVIQSSTKDTKDAGKVPSGSKEGTPSGKDYEKRKSKRVSWKDEYDSELCQYDEPSTTSGSPR